MRNKFYLFIILCFTSFYFNCSSENPMETQNNPNVTIKSIFFSDELDTDNDGYSSFARLYFDLDTDVKTLNVVVKVGIRTHSKIANEPYDIYFQSVPYTINGDTVGDAVYIEVGGQNSELDEGSYDFLIQVFKSPNLTEVIAEASSITHLNLANIKFERSSQELSPEWISNIDDNIFEGSYITPIKPPIGFSINALAEKFEIYSNTASRTIKKVRINIPYVNNPPQQIIFSIYGDDNNEPLNKLFTSNSYSISDTGWTVFELECDITSHPIFYISVPPSENYAVSTDNNSATLNGFRYEYVTSNPIREGWVAVNINYAIDVFIEY